MKIYAQIDGAGNVVAVTHAADVIEAAHLIEVEDGAGLIGKRWDGAAFVPVAVVVSEADAARAALSEIDRASGMSRLLRETLRAIAGANAPAKLVQYETEAATHRAKLGGGA